MKQRTGVFLAALLLGALVAGAAGAQTQPCTTDYNNFNGPRRLYLNVHNCGTDCAAQEIPYLELVKDGITGLRIAPVTLDRTQPGDPGFFTVNDFDPYFEAALEIFGPENLLVLIDDGVDEGRFKKPTPNDILRKLTSLLARHPQVRHIELMNEPFNFSNIGPEEYVGRYLRPARKLIDEFNADRAADNQIILYSAAWFGTDDGLRQTRRMVRAGGLAYVDVLSVHIYEGLAGSAAKVARDYKRLARGRPIAVTETNFTANARSDYETQQWWICDTMTRIERIMRQGLSPYEQLLQHNVIYTLRADEARLYNLIRFPDSGKSLAWSSTGPGHFVINERSKVPTDPKTVPADPGDAGDDGSDDAPAAGGERPTGRE